MKNSLRYFIISALITIGSTHSIVAFGSSFQKSKTNVTVTNPCPKLEDFYQVESLQIPVDLNLNGKSVTVNAHVKKVVLDSDPDLFNLAAVHGLAHYNSVFCKIPGELDKFGKYGTLFFIDLIQHGPESELLSGAVLGDIDLYDYADQVEQVLFVLAEEYELDVIVGHSMGGAIIEIVRDDLKLSDISPEIEWGTDAFVLMSPVLPAEVDWFWTTKSDPLLTSWTKNNSALGAYIDVPSIEHDISFFGGVGRVVFPGAPTVAQNRVYFNVPDSFIATAQMTGYRNIERFSVNANSFEGDNLFIVKPDADFWFSMEEMKNLYQHLVGYVDNARLYSPDGPHNAFYTIPESINLTFIDVIEVLN